MRLADYIPKFLFDKGIQTIFMVSGGGNMYLTDGMKKNKDINIICNHHEQASAMAAVGYAKARNSTGACLITTGCGGTNALTGLLHAYQDNIPIIFISGQVKLNETTIISGKDSRQYGTQEADIISIVRPITKKAIMLTSTTNIFTVLEDLYTTAISGRPGPVWVDVPMDIQKADIGDYIPEIPTQERNTTLSYSEILNVCTMLLASSKPLILVGHGVHLSKTDESVYNFARKFHIPIVCTRLGLTAIPTAEYINIGEIGIKGTRSANKAIQEADLILALGTRLSINSVGYDFHSFGKNAKLIVVDIDEQEHKKTNRNIDLFIHSDLQSFMSSLSAWYNGGKYPAWLGHCVAMKLQYPWVTDEQKKWKDGIHMYGFMDILNKTAPSNACFVADAGSAIYVVPQTLQRKHGQLLVLSGAQAEMGFTVPGAIGSSMISDCVIGITGDGSFQMNIQELQTIKHYNLPIKLFVWNNNGYLSIKTTQDKFFKGDYIGSTPESGISFPSLEKIAKAYELDYYKFTNLSDLQTTLENEVFTSCKPCICEIVCGGSQEVSPIVTPQILDDGTIIPGSFDNMYPFIKE